MGGRVTVDGSEFRLTTTRGCVKLNLANWLVDLAREVSLKNARTLALFDFKPASIPGNEGTFQGVTGTSWHVQIIQL